MSPSIPDQFLPFAKGGPGGILVARVDQESTRRAAEPKRRLPPWPIIFPGWLLTLPGLIFIHYFALSLFTIR